MRSRPARALAVILATLSLAVVNAPAPPSASAQTGDVGSALDRLAELDAATLALEDQIAAARADLDARRGELAAADAAADQARTDAAASRAAADRRRADVDELIRSAYSGNRTNRLAAVLVADSPQDLLDQMTALDLLGRDSGARLDSAAAASVGADRAAADAVAARESAAAAEQQAFRVQEDVVARRAALGTRSAEAQSLLQDLQGQPDTVEDLGAAPRLAASARADVGRASRATATRTSLFAQPTVGRVTSSYGARGGGNHGGTDIANAVGTPIVSVADGIVIDAGPASGFGLWVRVRHDDGTISVYGHIDSYAVSVGQSVSAGQQIAEMGNRGQSTGPHLHIEISTPGGGKTNPQAWLAERGVPV